MKNPDYVTGALQIKIAIAVNICGFQMLLVQSKCIHRLQYLENYRFLFDSRHFT